MTAKKGAKGKLILEQEVPYCTGAAWEVKKGQYIRVIARHTVDFVAFNLHNLSERFDQARTKTNQQKLFVTKGDVLYSKDNEVMMTIVEDTWPWHHDLQKGTCSRKRFELVSSGTPYESYGKGAPPPLPVDAHGRPYSLQGPDNIPPRGCWENLAMALKPWRIRKWDIPSPINLFQNMKLDGETGRLWFDSKTLPPGAPDAVVELRAEMDLLVAGSNDLDGTEPFRIQVYEG